MPARNPLPDGANELDAAHRSNLEEYLPLVRDHFKDDEEAIRYLQEMWRMMEVLRPSGVRWPSSI